MWVLSLPTNVAKEVVEEDLEGVVGVDTLGPHQEITRGVIIVKEWIIK